MSHIQDKMVSGVRGDAQLHELIHIDTTETICIIRDDIDPSKYFTFNVVSDDKYKYHLAVFQRYRT